MSSFHKPVMLSEVLDLLECGPGGVYVDGTVGGGGHALAILEKTAPDGRLIGIDFDAEALSEAGKTLHRFGERSILVQGNFADLASILASLQIGPIDGILLDLGVSSHQLDTAERGFSFSLDAPLDMRMDRGRPLSAYDLVNALPEDQLVRIIKDYGEENMARRIVKTISSERKRSPIRTTGQLARIVAESLPRPSPSKRTHPATKTFQALRIAVNDELANLRRALDAGIAVLGRGGRLAVITFHSLEDRIVKQTFRAWAKGCTCPPDLPVCACGKKPVCRVLTGRSLMPGPQEIDANPRARSARLRGVERI